jgi:hypothetical protein
MQKGMLLFQCGPVLEGINSSLLSVMPRGSGTIAAKCEPQDAGNDNASAWKVHLSNNGTLSGG